MITYASLLLEISGLQIPAIEEIQRRVHQAVYAEFKNDSDLDLDDDVLVTLILSTGQEEPVATPPGEPRRVPLDNTRNGA